MFYKEGEEVQFVSGHPMAGHKGLVVYVKQGEDWITVRVPALSSGHDTVRALPGAVELLPLAKKRRGGHCCSCCCHK